MKKYSIIILTFAFFSCNKSSMPAVAGQITDPAQYGTPYSNVPTAKDAIIYQVNIRAFSNTGNLQGVTARLDSIKALGVNVIYLMPIFPVGTVNSVNSPYCVKDFVAVGSEYGTLDDLRTLINTAHQKEMAVVLDIVPNHTSWDNPWITAHKDWYLQNASGNIVSPSSYNDVAQLNFNNTEMRQAMIKALRYWVFNANIDGYRMDFADNVPFDFWKEAITSLNSITTHKLLLIAEGTRNDHFNAGFQLKYGFGYYGGIKDIFGNAKSVTTISNINTSEYANAKEESRVLRYITNHDVNSSDGTPQQLFGGINGSLAAFVVAAYMRGTPMIYNGQEIGLSYKLSFPFTGPKINWTANPTITSAYKKILAFRNGSLAIKGGDLFTYSSDDVVAFTKQKNNEKVFVMVNLRNSAIEYTLPTVLTNTSWTDALNTGTVALSKKITLQPYTYLVLSAN